MTNILHVIGSPRGTDGASSKLAQAFFDSYTKAHASDTIDTLNVWTEELPPFASEATSWKLKTMGGMSGDAAEQAAFDRVLPLIQRLKAADKVVVSAGMWNFGVPYRLKHWIDLVVQVGHTFGFDPARGYFGLVTGRPLQLLLATGGDYQSGPMAAMDSLGPYLKSVFGFMGFTDIRTVTASCTAYPPEVSGPAGAKAAEEARLAAATF